MAPGAGGAEPHKNTRESSEGGRGRTFMSVQSGSKALHGHARILHTVWAEWLGPPRQDSDWGFSVPQYLLAVGKRGGTPLFL